MAKKGTKALEARFERALSDLRVLQDENVQAKEDLRQLAQAYDTQGWALVDGMNNSDVGVPLDAVQRFSKTNRALVAINPMVKKAKDIRVGYVFGEGVQFEGTTKRHEAFIETHYRTLFSEQAGEELETAWNSDGQVFLLLDAAKKRVIRVPMGEISGVATASDDTERVLYYQRTWREDQVLSNQAASEGKMRRCWYPVPDITPAEKVKLEQLQDNNIANPATLDSSKAMLHIPVNKQIGWVWGLPDVQSVVFWAKAYKEFMEDNYKLVRALARFTWKVTSATPRGVQRTAAKMAAVPAIDPLTGRTSDAGGAAVLGPGNDITAVNKAGANVNFEAGRPLAAMVAAGMGVPVDQLLATKGTSSDEKLDAPTLKTMMNRQAVVRRMYTQVFRYLFGENDANKIKVITPPIQSEAIHRVIQAIVTAATTNGLHAKEIRQMLVLALRQYGITPLPSLPQKGAYGEFVAGEVNENPGTSPANPPGGTDSGVSRSPSGALADGDHEQRNSEALQRIAEAAALLSQMGD